MAYHGVLIPEAISATNVDSYNRSAISSASPIDNGNVFALVSKSVTAGESEVWAVTAASALNNLWMAYASDEVVITDARYKGLDPDPRNFFTPAGKVFSSYKPDVGDIILVTADAISGSGAFLNATAGSLKLTGGASQTASALSYRYIKTTYISLATGAMDSQRITAYEYECIAN